MAKSGNFNRAEKEIKKAMRTTRQKAELYVHLGYIQKQQNNEKEAVKNYEKALAVVVPLKQAYVSLSDAFLSYSEFDYAKQVYKQGEKQLPDEIFHTELGRIYMYQRNYGQMIDEYLSVLSISPDKLFVVQSRIFYALSRDVNGDLFEMIRKKLISKIQQEPGNFGFNRLLIWILIQEKKFAEALRQQIALDKRSGDETSSILNLADIAANNKEYNDAIKAYDYILAKGENNYVYRQVVASKMELLYQQFIDFGKSDIAEAQKINEDFKHCFSVLGFTPENFSLLINHAHLLAFYLQKTEEAIALLNKSLSIPGLDNSQISGIKTEKADINVYDGDEWEAVLLYSQVIEDNKTNTLGDEVKFKKAKLSYFLGDFKWAQAQLDVIKASTEKLTSNDAFELSALISNNLSLDTNNVPMKMFSQADLCLFRNQNSQALAVLDSILTEYPTNSLRAEVLFRKASVFQKQGDYKQAAENLKLIIDNNSYSLLADNALFDLAEIYEFHFNKKEEAKKLYRRMLVEYPGSVLVSKSRNRYRYLRGDSVATDPNSIDIN